MILPIHSRRNSSGRHTSTIVAQTRYKSRSLRRVLENIASSQALITSTTRVSANSALLRFKVLESEERYQ